MTAHHPEEILLPQLNSFSSSLYGRTTLSLSRFNVSALTYLALDIASPLNILTQILESAKNSILTLRLEELCVVDNDVLSIALSAPHLQILEYPVCERPVTWLNDQMCHDTLREISISYNANPSPFGSANIFCDHFRPISKRRFPMLRTVTVAPMVDYGPYDVLGVYDLEDGKRLEDADSARPMKLFFHSPHD
ncbi:hypothetical protein BD410DRAFT_902329 [Rickenella mellea]|uniref:F-box domain-containing protein n=1 Tax=Rickenella mellea TaxID=50990 RepID=A0A4Y7PMR8_9AGAM|nr:hypothetical protein BD410DRAFT_902329 [Rickenella mellea]